MICKPFAPANGSYMFPRQGDSDPFTASALYDLNADISETNDLAAAHPEITEELLALAEQSRTDLGHANTLGRDQRPAGMVEHPTLRLKN